MARDWFGRICVFFSTSRRCSRKRSANLLPVSPMKIFLHSVQVMQWMTFVEMHVKWSATLTDRLGPEILTVLQIKGQVLHLVRLHVKVPGWLLNLNALLTKTLPKFLSRLNEMSGGRENMCLVSGSLRRI